MNTTISSDLPNERFDAIRSRVLYQVDADINARGRRVRRRIAGGVGALAVLVIAGVAAQPLIGVGGGNDMPTVYRDSGVFAGGSAESMPAPGDMDARKADDATSLDAAAAPPETAGDQDREIITTGSANVTVKNPVKASTQFMVWVTRHDGRIDGQGETRDEDGGRSATLDVRLPSKHVNAAVAQLRTYGDVNDVGLQRTDVTAQGRDLDARIKALRVSIERLEAILGRSASTTQVIEAETALSERQQELESLLSERRSLTDQVSLSSIHIMFTQRDRAGEVEPDGFMGGIIKGWNALVDTVNAVVTALGVLAPWLGVGLVLGAGWWITRKLRPRRSVD